MKKLLFIFSLVLVVICKQPGNAILVNQTPERIKNNNVIKSNSTKNKSGTSKTQIKYQQEIKQPVNRNINQVPTISVAQKQKYYDDYLKYLEQTIKNMGCFSSSEISDANIAINLSLDANSNVTAASVNAYTRLADNGKLVEIDRDLYNKKCKYCESKLFVTKFKPFDNRYATGNISKKDFFITLKSSEVQKETATQQVIGGLKSYCWTPPVNSENQYAVVKIILTFGKDTFIIKGYQIINSSGNDEYNLMVNAALKKSSKMSWSCFEYNHDTGDLTIYLKFNGNNISPASASDYN